MGWVTLTLRKQTLKASISSMQFQDIQLSRQLRAVSRNLNYDESIMNMDKAKELKAIKEAYNKIRDQRPSVSSDEYEEWKVQFTEAQQDYQSQKQDVEDYYDNLKADIESESSDEEQAKQEEQTMLESQLQALQAELETVVDQIKSDIDTDKISLS